MRLLEKYMFISLLVLSASMVNNSHLPPLLPWEGASTSLLQQQGPLTTDFEISAGVSSPNYADTMAFVDRLVAANPTQFKSKTIGKRKYIEIKPSALNYYKSQNSNKDVETLFQENIDLKKYD